jgi:hypothetical protein
MKIQPTLSTSNGPAADAEQKDDVLRVPNISDGASTEIVGGGLEVGQTVLIGGESSAPTTTMPGPGLRL